MSRTGRINNQPSSIPDSVIRRILAMSPANLIQALTFSERSGTSAKDVSGNGRNGTFSNVTLGVAGPDGYTATRFVPGSLSYCDVFGASLAAAFNGNSGTVLVHCKVSGSGVWSDGVTRDLMRMTVDGSNFVILRKTTTANQLGCYHTASGTAKSVLSTAVAPTGWMAVALVINSGTIYGYRDGQLLGSTPSIGTYTGTPTLAYVGMAGAYWDGDIGPSAIWTTPLAGPDVAIVSNCTGYVTFEGDSRTADDIYPAAAMADASMIGKRYGYANVGLSGDTVNQMNTDGATQVDVNYRGTFNKNIAVLWGGVNDASAGASAATLYSRIQTWCNARRAAGMKTIVCTEIDCQSAALNAVSWHSTLYPALNALIVAGWTTFADGLVNLGADSRLQDANDLTYFNADKLHPNATGKAVIGSLVAPVIAGL